MMLAKGSLDGTQIFKPETVALMTAIHTPAEMKDKRALGWDVDTAYSRSSRIPFPAGLLWPYRMDRHLHLDRAAKRSLPDLFVQSQPSH